MIKDIRGILSIANKIWFNDANKCRLRICGFNKKQIKQLENPGLIDITITKINEHNKHENNRVYKIEAVMSIEDNITEE